MEAIDQIYVIAGTVRTKEIEDKDIDVLFCEETCEFTDDLSTIVPEPGPGWKSLPGFKRTSGADTPQCDDVCELLGGPLTFKEKVLLCFKEKIVFPLHHAWHHRPIQVHLGFGPTYDYSYVIKNEYPEIGKKFTLDLKWFGTWYFKKVVIIYGD